MYFLNLDHYKILSQKLEGKKNALFTEGIKGNITINNGNAFGGPDSHDKSLKIC